MKLDRSRVITLVLIIVILLTVAFIWSNSLATRNESDDQSRSVLGLLSAVFGISPPEWLIRKTAHFCEFALLGAELTVMKFRLPRVTYTAPLLVGLLVALTDETLQLLTDRSSRVGDVWLDFAGVIAGAVFALTVRAIFAQIKKRRTI